MKLTKLPTAKIPSTQQKKKFTVSVIVKSILATLIAVLLAVMTYIIVITTQQNNLLNSKSASMMMMLPQTNSAVVTATTHIISRDGGIPSPIAKKYAVWIYESAAAHGVDPILILSVMQVESQFNYRAISPTGPIGLLQVAWSWHKEKVSRDGLFDPKTNILVGTQILKEYRDMSKTEVESLLRYNGSLGAESPKYAIKVLSYKSKYEKEILAAVANSI